MGGCGSALRRWRPATIGDIDSPGWTASLRAVVGLEDSVELVTIFLLDGDRAGAFAIGRFDRRDGYAIVNGTTRFGLGHPEPEIDLAI